MKLYQDYKKHFSFLLIGFLVFIPMLFIYAESKEELNQKINAKSTEIDNLEEEIQQYQNQLNALSKEKSSLNNSIKELDLTKKKLNADILVTSNKIDKKNLEIKNLGSQIMTKEDLIENNKEAIALGIKKSAEFEQSTLIEILVSKNDFFDLWNNLEDILTLRKKISEKIKELKETKTELVYTREETILAKNELTSLKNKLSDQKKIVEQNVAEKNKLLKQTQNNESNYQKLLKDRLAKKDAFEKELEEYESQLKFILDPSSLPNKGVLAWPLDNVFVTQLFGITQDSKRLYASGSHSGVDFRASVGTPVKAVADGTVAGTGDTDLTCPYASFGKFIFIQHNNGLATAYGHLSLIKVNKGDKIRKGQIIGYSGNTGHTTGPHLHLTVYAGAAAKMETRPSKACEGRSYTIPIAPTNAYLDPMYYLPKLDAKFFK